MARLAESAEHVRDRLVQENTALDQAVGDQPDKMKAAALAALELTRDAGSRDTHWYVYDRVTGTGRFITQAEFDSIRDAQMRASLGSGRQE